MSAFTYTPKPKPNQTERQTKNVHELDFIFSVLVAKFQQIRQGIVIRSALTQPRGLFIT